MHASSGSALTTSLAAHILADIAPKCASSNGISKPDKIDGLTIVIVTYLLKYLKKKKKKKRKKRIICQKVHGLFKIFYITAYKKSRLKILILTAPCFPFFEEDNASPPIFIFKRWNVNVFGQLASVNTSIISSGEFNSCTSSKLIFVL